ncbi:MAG: glycosyltransferase family 2 protein [Candidatus Gastranaerophilaceae bacterium]
MNRKPKISIIVPVYNVGKYLRKCLNSLIYQTYSNLEIICINDGSTDDSLEILKEYSKSDSRIVLIDKKNEGVSVARNIGIKTATGDYISFIDSDDWVFLTLYAEFVEYINKVNSDVDIYMFDIASYVKGENDVIPRTLLFTSDWNNHKDNYTIHSFDDCTKPFSHNISACNKIYKRSFLTEENIFFPEKLQYEDTYFCITTCLRSKSILINPNIFYRYRNVSDGSAMSSVTPKVFDIFKIFDLIDMEINKLNLYEDYKYALFQHKYNLYIQRYFKCPEELKTKYYDEMKQRLLIAEQKKLNPQIYTKLRNFEIFSLIKNKSRAEFDIIVEQNKNKQSPKINS